MNNNERIDEINDSLRLIQKIGGLTFGSDAYLLYAYMKKKPRARAADLGAGTGIISLLALNRGKYSHVHAIEVQESFATLISRNALLNSLDTSLTVHHLDLRDANPELVGGELDVVFSNPPYMTVSSGFLNEDEGKRIARHEMFGTIRDFSSCADRLLKYGGSFYIVYRPDRLSDLLASLRASHMEIKRMTFVHATVKHPPSLVLIEAKKGASVGLFLTKPLILADEYGNQTEDIKKIYELGEFGKDYERP